MAFKRCHRCDEQFMVQEYNTIIHDSHKVIKDVNKQLLEQVYNSIEYITDRLSSLLRLKNILEEQLANPNLSYAERYKLNKRLEYCKENIKTWEAKKQEYEEKQKVEKLKKSYAKYLQKQKNNGR